MMVRSRCDGTKRIRQLERTSMLGAPAIRREVIERKVPSRNDFHSPAEVEDRLRRLQDHYGAVARPFQWTFGREGLRTPLAKIHA
jgi:hypothetical protein